MTQSLGWFHEGTPGKEAYLGTCLPLATACSGHLAGLASTPQDACHPWQVSGSEAESWLLFSLLLGRGQSFAPWLGMWGRLGVRILLCCP